MLLHEGLGCVAMWRDFPQKLAQATGCRTVVWSRYGYGASDPRGEPRTARYMHDEALHALPELLKVLKVEKPLLVGHSDGASIALIFAGAFPEVPVGLVAMAPHSWVEEEALAGIREARAYYATSDWREKLRRYHPQPDAVFSAWNDTWLSAEFRDWNITEYLPNIRCPVLALQGLDDEYASLRQIEVIAEMAPDVDLLELADCRHSPHRDQPEAVLAAIAGFVDKVVFGVSRSMLAGD